MLDRLAWLGHSGFAYRAEEAALYVDPFRMPEELPTDEPAGIVLVTHCHFDHCSPADIERIASSDTVIVCPHDCIPQLQDLPGERLIVEVGTKLELMGLEIEAVPAYTRKSRLHGREHGWVGYVVVDDGVRWYHAGDTDYIAEMKGMGADIACLPVSGGTVMNAVEAAAAARAIGPEIAVPMHFGSIAGSVRDAELFRNMAQSVDVRIPTLPQDE